MSHVSPEYLRAIAALMDAEPVGVHEAARQIGVTYAEAVRLVESMGLKVGRAYADDTSAYTSAQTDEGQESERE